VLGQVHRLAISRLAAAVLALALSGAVRVAAAQDAHDGTHRCSCPVGAHGAHECSCPACQRALAEAAPSPEELAKLPPCHRALAATAVRRAPVPTPKPDQDCASPLCSLPDGRLAAAPTTDTFLLPEPPRLAAVDFEEPLVAPSRPPAAVAASPEPPPPRS